MPFRYLSFSDVDLFNQCEQRYWLEKVDGRKPPENAYLLVGQAYHLAIAAKLQGLSWPGVPVDLADKLRPVGVNVENLEAEIKENLARLQPLLAALGPPLRAPERYFRNRQLGYKGVIDAVFPNTPLVSAEGIITGAQSNGGPCVLDWKVLSSDRRRSARDAVLSPQLALYALQEQVNRAAFCEIPRDLEKPIKVRVVEYRDDEKEHWRQFLSSTRAALFSRGRRKEAYKRCDRKSQPLCSPLWCPHFSDCYPTVDDQDTQD